MNATVRTRNSARRLKRKLFLFCAHRLAQEQFARLLKRTEFDILPSSQLRLPDESVKAFDATEPCLAVIDGGDVLTAIEFVRTLRNEQRSVNLLLLLPGFEDSVTFPLLRLGVKGLLTYQQTQRELARAACQVASGGYWVPRELLTRFVEAILPELQGAKTLHSEVGISRREREVLDLLLNNLSNKEIASKLFVSERAIKFHVSNLLSKFKVQRRADLIVLWMQRANSYTWMSRGMDKNLSLHVN